MRESTDTRAADLVAALLVALLVAVAPRAVTAATFAQSTVHALLDVPYVAQTPELCGGAAVAMVLRYWGARDVFPQDFAPLLGAGAGGVLTSALVASVRDRGWQAVVLAPDDTSRVRLRSEIDQGRPIIALVAVGSGIYHYVVIVGSTESEVVLHDPARAPFRAMPWAEFDVAWKATGRWMLLVLPPDGFRPAGRAPQPTLSSPRAAVAVDASPCAALVDRGVSLALTGDADGAEQVLEGATRLCPNDAASWREFAGLRFSQSRWPEAHRLALSALRLAPDDAYAGQLVATSRYLMGDALGALDAWNGAEEPRIDAIDIHGAVRTRQPVILRATGLRPREVLTREAFGRAIRRARDIPVASAAHMTYASLDGGLARVDVFIDERRVVPIGWMPLAVLGARAVMLNEVRVDVAGPLGAGELTSAAWRWSAGRPRVTLSLALPSPQWLRGVITLDGLWERQSYDATPSSGVATLLREERRRIGLRFADWSTSWLHWNTGAALDRLPARDLDEPDRQPHDALAIESALDVRLAADRFALAATADWWTPFAGTERFSTGGLLVAWRSTPDTTLPGWSALTEISGASRSAPLALWHGAGTGQGRSGLLRAHPLLHEGVFTGPVFGRQVARSSFEYVRPVGPARWRGVAIAGFVDTARAWDRLGGIDPSRMFIDAGVGVRVHAPGAGAAIRIDVAHGLRGGGTTLSAGWGGAWPR